MTQPPLITIILPFYNSGVRLEAAVNSVLAQDLSDWELLAIDDGSTDGSADFVRRLTDTRIRLISNNANLGLQRSLNIGLKAARGHYIARLDADDEWLDKSKLRQQAEFLRDNPDHLLVGTGVVVFGSSGKELFRFLNPSSDRKIRRRLLGRNQFVHSSVMFARKAAGELGGYSESPSHKHVEDHELWLRLGQRGKMANLPLHCTGYTLQKGQISQRYLPEQIRKNLELIKEFQGSYPGSQAAAARVRLRQLIYGYGHWEYMKKISSFFKR